MTTKLPANDPDNRRQGSRRGGDRRDDDQPLVLEWSDEFSTGIRAIDNDHRGLFEQFKLLNDHFSSRPDPENLGPIIEGLQKYVAEHFDREESFMSHAHYSGLEEHKKEHREATKLIVELGLIYEDNPESIDGKKVIHFLSRWLTGHILGSDMNYVPYLTGVSETLTGANNQDTHEECPPVELETLTLQLRPEQVDSVQKFTRAMADGGRVAAALIEAVNQVATKRSAVVHESAVKTFCKDETSPS